MIKSVRLVNFFSFSDCTINLESDVNVLVGINGSGKSNFLRAFQLLKAGMDGRLQEQIVNWGGIDSIRQKNSTSQIIRQEIELFFTVSSPVFEPWPDGYTGDIVYCILFSARPNNDFIVDELVRKPDGYAYLNPFVNDSIVPLATTVNSAKRFKINDGKELLLPSTVFDLTFKNLGLLHVLFRELEIYKLFNTVEDAPMRTAVRATGITKLLPNGDNVFQVLNTTGLKSVSAYDAIEKGLQNVNENFVRFRMNVYGQGSLEVYLQEKELETPIHAAQASDGTLCYLCLLVALYQADRHYVGRLIIFDEPERNLHPDMLIELGKQLEKASEKSQIILTTHAPGLLNQFPLRAVRVFEKDEHNQTQVRRFTEADFAGWYEEFAPGQMWRDGALGGNRY